MDLIDQLNTIANRLQHIETIHTEEATKNAFVMPFIQALGYDIFNPLEVVPEFTADIGLKKGEKVDYAIVLNGTPIVIIEAKHWQEKLDAHSSQLLRYFHVTEARFAILTNGISCQFFTDLENPNKMDTTPFLEFDLNDITPEIISELKKFHKSNFDVEKILTTANELKYTNAFINILKDEFKNPTEPFIKALASRFYEGRYTAKIYEQFIPLVKKSILTIIDEKIKDRLKTAMAQSQESETLEALPSFGETEPSSEQETECGRIITTDEEIESFYIIKTILRTKLGIGDLYYKDTVNYFAIGVDPAVRKVICRLRFNSRKKFLGLMDDNRKETRIEISSLDDLINYTEHFVKVAQNYLNSNVTAQ